MARLFSFTLAILIVRFCVGGPGALDLGFQPLRLQSTNIVFGPQVSAIVLQPDGKILIGGPFSVVQGQPRNSIARLNADGSLDTSFSAPTSLSSKVSSIALQPDGRILINTGIPDGSGQFHTRITRLHPNGAIDASFDAGSASADEILLDPSGKIYICGEFTQLGDYPDRQYILARLNADGSWDTTYRPAVGGNGTSESGMVTMTLQPDSKLLLGGMFGGRPRSNFARINYDGAPDESFNGDGAGAYFCNVLTVQPDGKILHGFMKWLDGPLGYDTYAAVLRFHPDGRRDTNFATNNEIPGRVNTIVVQPDGKILSAGSFTTIDGSWKQHIVRLHADGARDDGFVFGEDAFVSTGGAANYIERVILQPDGKILVAGRFDHDPVSGQRRPYLVRLKGDPAHLTKLQHIETGEIEMTWTIADRNLTYRVEGSFDLKNWEGLETINNGATVSLRSSARAANRFFRLVTD
jgi:uncharacterized delta-60 repeat protein